MSQLKTPGKEVVLGGRKLIIAPLNFAALKQHREAFANMTAGGLPDMELVCQLSLLSLQRNYPEMTLDEVEEIIDYGNLFEVWEALLNITAMVEQAGKMVRSVEDKMTASRLTT